MSFLHSLVRPFLSLYFSLQSKRKLPQINGTLEIYGLKDPVTISRDKHGVPHIQAGSESDLFFAQGFVHAQDRLWQMELNRRVATGTLSELFGDVAVETDKLSRTLGFNRLGKKDWELQSDGAKIAIEAYVKGVNAYLNHLDTSVPIEFGLAKADKPKNWTKDDCLAISRLMIWQLSHAWYSEFVRTQLIDAVGEEHANLLEIQYHPDNPIQLPNGLEFNIFKDGSLKKGKGPFLHTNMGSNAWVVSAEKSKTGSPLLANDMHLRLSTPSIWYHNHLKATTRATNNKRNLNTTGVSFPGLPMVLVGHNADIAWGATLSYNDVEDLYIEKLDEAEEKYQFKDEWVDIETIPEIIKIKDDINQQQIVKITGHGPIISDFLETQETLALQSKSLQPARSITGWYELNHASDWDEFINAIEMIEAPSLNVVYADSTNIGYYNTGRVPQRPNSDGRLPMPGWTGEYEWGKDIPFKQMPHTFNPEKGYFVTSNNKVISDDYKYASHLGHNFMNGFRAARLEEYFAEHEKIGFEESKQMQMDFTSVAAPQFLLHFEGIKLTDPNTKVVDAYKIMIQWDGKVTADSVGATLYQATRHMTSRLLFEPHLGEDLTNKLLGDGFHPLLLPSSEYYSQDISILLRLLDDDDDSWWLSHAGGKEKLLIRAFKRGFEYLMDNFGTDVSKWKWGKLHKITFDHAFQVEPLVAPIFSQGPYEIGGDTDTPNQFSLSHTFAGPIDWAPSWRQIIDLGDVTRSEWMYAPGQSGQLGSKHYGDLIQSWLEGNYHTLYWTKGQVEKNLEGELTLNPQLR